MRSLAACWFLPLLAVGAVAALGCNMVTGADDLVVGPGADDGSGGSSSTSGSSGTGAGTTSSSSGDGGSGLSGSGTGGQPPGQELVPADGVMLTDIDLYQAIRRPLLAGGAPATSNIPVVAGRAGMMRLFYFTDGNYNGQPVTVRLTIDSAPAIELSEMLSGASSHEQLGSTINLQVPGELLKPGAAFKVEMLQPPEVSSGGNGGAAYPLGEGLAPLEVEQGGVKLKILLVPVENNGSLPDTTPTQVQRYHTWFSEVYPVPEVEVTVRSQPYTFNSSLGSYDGWSNLLDSITDLRDQDNAPADVYYYGIHNADGNGLLGLGWVAGATDVWSRTAIGVGWSGDTAPETAVHEVGHNHGRPHSPCGVSGDPAYPHPGASIGVWGYRPSTNQLLDPNQYVDFMSYCDPTWISDWNFRHIFERAKLVSTSAKLIVPEVLQNRTYDRIKVLEGLASWRPPVTLRRPPQGETLSVQIATPGGPKTVTGQYYPYNHLQGGLIYVLQPLQMTQAETLGQAVFAVEGQTFTLTR
ncbi:MAG: hypothetical protein DRI90_05075 [Deltaproteobacteria bacterium]|nr:MAG: hypothetical protein DRI90_05075 [Deltaproteobacteria bacterium]